MIRTLLASTALVALCFALTGCEGRSTAGAGAQQGQQGEKAAPKPAPGSKVGDQVGQTEKPQ